MSLTPFHLAIPVHELETARTFYGDIMGLVEGRSSDCWIDYNLFGHQLVVHQVAKTGQAPENGSGSAAGADQEAGHNPESGHNPVDGHDVPVPHFGVVLEMAEWEKLAARLKEKGVQFAIEPYIRFQGQPGEQATLFFYDPSGNALEFKAFRDIESQLFAS